MKIGPKFKIARRLGSRIFPKTETTKFTISGSSRRRERAGRRHRGLSDYGLRLLEKQKVRYSYGLKEYQLANYVREVRAGANPVSRLFEILESRLDNVVFRLGFARSRFAARQLITHGHIFVNGRRVTAPALRARIGDRIAIRPASRKLALFADLQERLKQHQLPAWLSFDQTSEEGEVKAKPAYGEAEVDLHFGALLEFYRQ